MTGPRGAAAVVNGRPVVVGSRLGEAVVVAITSRAVEVEAAGERMTLGR
jgi:hypothetical protein